MTVAFGFVMAAPGIEHVNSVSNRDEEEEKEHFQRIVSAFRHYRTHSLQRLTRTERYLASLPAHHQKKLQRYQKHLAQVRISIEHNNEIIKLIIKDVTCLFENVKHDVVRYTSKPVSRPTASDMEKVQSVLKQFIRDWSEDGSGERFSCYQPIIDEIEANFPQDECDPRDVQVLVPGAGLGRLSFEIARRGYTCQGNEFSLFMLFASNFILNRCRGVNSYRVYPWIHQYVNNLKDEDQIRHSSFPDIDPSDLTPNSQLSMVAGDFLEVYTESDIWDSVATCFFIDCANNIVAFIETIYNILKPGGIWINLGPLLYHFADIIGEDSIEPSYEIVRSITIETGFQIEKEETNVKTSYAQNPSSMLKYEYQSVFFVARKPMMHENNTTPAVTEGR